MTGTFKGIVAIVALVVCGAAGVAHAEIIARILAVVGGQPVRDEVLLTWARDVVDSVVDRVPAGAQSR